MDLLKHKIIPNLISELPFDILKMSYHLVLEEEHGVLLLRLRHYRLSTTYALGPGILDAQWHDMNDADMEVMLKDEECRYGTPCTGVNVHE